MMMRAPSVDIKRYLPQGDSARVAGSEGHVIIPRCVHVDLAHFLGERAVFLQANSISLHSEADMVLRRTQALARGADLQLCQAKKPQVVAVAQCDDNGGPVFQEDCIHHC